MQQREGLAGIWYRLAGFPRPVWILFLGTFLNKFGTFVMPFLALYMTRRGFTTAQAGMAVGAYGVGQLIASAVGGHLADTLGRRKTIVLSMFSGAGSMMLLSQATSFYGIMIVTGLVGLTAEFYRPAATALLADLVPPEQRVTAFSAYRTAFNAGWAFGPATAGFLAGHSFFWLFAGDAASSVLFGLVAWFALPAGHKVSESTGHWLPAAKTLIRDRRMVRLLLASLFIALVFLQMGSTFGLDMTRRGFSDATYGAILSLNGVLVVFCELPITTITQKFPARKVMAVGYLMIGAGFALNAAANSVPLLVLVMVVFTLGEMTTMPVSSAYVASLAPPEFRGRAMGISGLSWSAALICGPSLGMALLAISPTALWLTCGACGVLAAMIITLGRD